MLASAFLALTFVASIPWSDADRARRTPGPACSRN